MENDLLWPHFRPLWQSLKAHGNESVLVAGGYALFLKHQWLLEHGGDKPIVVPFERWQDDTPRVTKDMDLVLGLDLISNKERHEPVLQALEENGFNVSEKPSGQRWQFVKEVAPDKNVLLEFHAPMPEEGAENLKVTPMRVKCKPSLGVEGIHGRTNPEAVGAATHPFKFELEGVEISTVNAATLCVMKLTAMRDRWETSQSTDNNAEANEFARLQSFKHGQDVCRIIAMLGDKERETSKEVLSEISKEPIFESSKAIFADYFPDQNPAAIAAKSNWQDNDFDVIAGLLKEWFGA